MPEILVFLLASCWLPHNCWPVSSESYRVCLLSCPLAIFEHIVLTSYTRYCYSAVRDARIVRYVGGEGDCSLHPEWCDLQF
ncbi:hypothetical protein BDV93DRAFT_169830 [Ceratobasidium sp. AG-I]|nr:hypothetical protein BDV93DRAFT_169830 [Ceratobasidium sp. AG-I]